jgi:uncharacterized repeat protein (TIGR02543 family)
MMKAMVYSMRTGFAVFLIAMAILMFYAPINVNAALPDSFDWRNRHSANNPDSPYFDGDLTGSGWITGVKSEVGNCQLTSKYCVGNQLIGCTADTDCNSYSQCNFFPVFLPNCLFNTNILCFADNDCGGCKYTCATNSNMFCLDDSECDCNHGWAFSSVGVTEAIVNLYYNQQLDVSLSEQDVASCSGGEYGCWTDPAIGPTGCVGGNVASPLDYIADTGVVDARCYPYSYSCGMCSDKCLFPSQLIKSSGKIPYCENNPLATCNLDAECNPYAICNAGSCLYNPGMPCLINSDCSATCFGVLADEDALKRTIIFKGPVTAGLTSLGKHVVIAGFDKDLVGNTRWLVKNSVGTSWGTGGFDYIQEPFADLYDLYAMQTPIVSVRVPYVVACNDWDGDGYYNWGIGPMPGTCPPAIPVQEDCDDTNANLGPMDADGNCTFNNPVFTLDVSKPTGGMVQSSSLGIYCGFDCTEVYQDNSPTPPPYVTVTLTAIPDPGASFVTWGGGCAASGSNPVCVVTMDGNKNVTATFLQQDFTLAVTRVGSGTVTSNPTGIDCGLDCASLFAGGTPVTLSAVSGPGWTFVGWEGACTGTGDCNVTMNTDLSVTAVFQELYTLTASRSGSGTITSTPSGINCGFDCTEDYLLNTQVTLIVTPDPGWGFSGWSGACAGTGACDLTMNGPKSVNATFLPLYRLTAHRVGVGTIMSTTDNGIACGADCWQDYVSGTPVSLSVITISGWNFAGWSGACTGTGTCNLIMNGPKDVTGTFLPVFALTVGKDGNGTVTSAPPGINCGSDCTEAYESNITVTLTATAATGWFFDSWSGCDSSAGNTCSVLMNNVKNVTAKFIQASPVYRFWSDVYLHHFYTISESEKNYVIATWPDVWSYEGIVWYAFPTQVPGTLPVYRFWSGIYSAHFYTISEADKNYVLATWPTIWSFEGIVYYALPPH